MLLFEVGRSVLKIIPYLFDGLVLIHLLLMVGQQETQKTRLSGDNCRVYIKDT